MISHLPFDRLEGLFYMHSSNIMRVKRSEHLFNHSPARTVFRQMRSRTHKARKGRNTDQLVIKLTPKSPLVGLKPHCFNLWRNLNFYAELILLDTFTTNGRVTLVWFYGSGFHVELCFIIRIGLCCFQKHFYISFIWQFKPVKWVVRIQCTSYKLSKWVWSCG